MIEYCAATRVVVEAGSSGQYMVTQNSKLGLVILSLLFVVSACEAVNAITEALDAISDGAPCNVNAGCLGGRCLTESEQGFPGGYCTTLSCESQGCTGFASECFRDEVSGKSVTLCYELCNFDGTCDRADEGYQCVQLNDTGVCLPPTAVNAPVQGAIGSACSNNLQCNGDNATCLTTFFGGYCSRLDCTDASDCIDGNPCVVLNPSDATPKTACMQGCSTDDDCRFGYACADYEGSRICLEANASGPRNPDGEDDGLECVANINCKGGTCIRANEEEGGATSYPGGYCTTRDCESDTDCNGDSICVSRTRSTACFKTCTSNDDCRSGYECRGTQEGGSICDSVIEAVLPDPDSSPFEVQCGSDKSLTFTMPEGTLGFYIAPFAPNGEKVVPNNLTYPDGTRLNIPSEYSWFAVNPELLGSLAPINFPGSDRSNFQNAFGPGEYTLDVQTSASELCWYVIPKTQEGRQLDINLYFVGTGITAAQAPGNASVKRVESTVQGIYSKMGVQANITNYFDASDAVAQQYGIIRDFYDVFNLVATSQAPGSTTEEALSVNVFLIEDFNISEAPGLLGVSTGIPGMAGLHGNSGAGLVFSAASLGRDDQQLGQTMAHEIGHFVGLRHTTEHYGSAHDPITDTPECIAPDLAFLCSDSDNFMFAFALGGAQNKTTAGQAFVVKRSALVK